MGINMSFHVDWMKNFAPYVADLLNADIPALIYAGDLDFICNYMGNRAWTLKLDWKHKDEFNAAEEHDWNDGAGLARTAGGLTFLQVYDAGHMVVSYMLKCSLLYYDGTIIILFSPNRHALPNHSQPISRRMP